MFRKAFFFKAAFLTKKLKTVFVEFNNSLPELLCSDEDSGNEDVLDMEYTEAEAEDLKRNAEVRGRGRNGGFSIVFMYVDGAYS